MKVVAVKLLTADAPEGERGDEIGREPHGIQRRDMRYRRERAGRSTEGAMEWELQSVRE